VRNFSVESQSVIKKFCQLNSINNNSSLLCDGVLREIIKNASGEGWFLIPVKNHETISNNDVSSRKLSCESPTSLVNLSLEWKELKVSNNSSNKVQEAANTMSSTYLI